MLNVFCSDLDDEDLRQDDDEEEDQEQEEAGMTMDLVQETAYPVDLVSGAVSRLYHH